MTEASITTAPEDSQTEALPPFKLDNWGVYRNEDGEWIWLCSYLRVEALCRNSQNEEWAMLLAVNDFDAKTHLLVMPRSKVAAGQACQEELLSRGLVVSTQPKAGRWLQQYLNHECFEAKKRVRLVNKCGWHEGRLFILPERALGETGGEVFHFQGEGLALHQAGTLAQWQEHVAGPAVGNSRLVLALSASFAGPLLEPLGEESGGQGT